MTEIRNADGELYPDHKNSWFQADGFTEPDIHFVSAFSTEPKHVPGSCCMWFINDTKQKIDNWKLISPYLSSSVSLPLRYSHTQNPPTFLMSTNCTIRTQPVQACLAKWSFLWTLNMFGSTKQKPECSRKNCCAEVEIRCDKNYLYIEWCKADIMSNEEWHVEASGT